MAVTQYIGSRYVPLFADPAEWSSTKEYEPLTIVLHEGNSYTSKQFVPVGIDITNTDFWALTGNYNAQVELYRRETAQALNVANDANNNATTAQASANEAFNLANTAANAADSAQNDIDTLLPKEAFSESLTIKSYIDAAIAEISKPVSTYEMPYCDYDDDLKCYVTMFKFPRSNMPFIAQRYTDYQNCYKYIDTQTKKIICNGTLGGPCISNGVIKQNEAISDTKWCYVMGVTADGRIDLLQDPTLNYTGETLRGLGYEWAWTCWFPIVLNGSAFNPSTIENFEGYDASLLNAHTRMIFAWNDNYWYIIAVDGRIPFSNGPTFDQMIALCTKFNLRNAMNMDGGGSVQLWSTNPSFNWVFANSTVSAGNVSSPKNTRDVQNLFVWSI